ncbi:MAG: acetolactate synthase, partial [Candidatus Lambdaproteobacteria bacterium]|nr:acetolactate synthase [Candidatus Lambdaproteobacteria bacterium]
HNFMSSRRYAFNKADVIVIVGTPFDFRMGYGQRLGKGATIVQVDMNHGTVGKNRDVDLGLVGDVGAILGAVAQAASGRKDNGAARRKAWLQELRAEEGRLHEEALPRLKSDASPIHPLRLCHEINQFLTENSVYIGDGGDIVTFSGSVVQPRRPGHWMDPGPLGTLGVGTSFAMASKLCQPEKEVVVLFGYGAFSLTGWDFETMVRFKLPFVGIVGNNSAWNQIRFGQIGKYGAARGNVANLLSDVRFDKFAEMLGGHGEHVTEPGQIAGALRRARESGKPSLVNVVIDREAFSSGTQNQTMYK